MYRMLFTCIQLESASQRSHDRENYPPGAGAPNQQIKSGLRFIYANVTTECTFVQKQATN